MATFKADAAAAEQLQEQVAALSPVAEQLPSLKALYGKLQVGRCGCCMQTAAAGASTC